MDPNVSEWLNLVFRWIHVLAGILWIGHLWFFNFVNSQLAKTYDADSKKKVLPELMPRALFWFRWGAAYTWITGILLLGIVYYMAEETLKPTNPGANYLGLGPTVGIALGMLVVGFALYHVLWKRVFATNERVGGIVSFVLVAATAFGLSRIMGGRAMFIHIGGLFGTIMAANVWMVIWPNQRKIIAGVKGTAAAPEPSVAAIAGLRSKHNTYMSVPLVLTMVSNHFGTIIGSDWNWAILSGFIALGWLMTWRIYAISAQPRTAAF